MIKEGNKRLMLTLSEEEIQKLKVIMFDLKTRQPSKAISYLIANYKR
nr:MAG: hypothetical protein [Microvirus sp.]